jgi:hypothetical protein
MLGGEHEVHYINTIRQTPSDDVVDDRVDRG